jgi:hypothetical protein
MEFDKIIYNAEEYYCRNYDNTYSVAEVNSENKVVFKIILDESEYSIINNKLIIDDVLINNYVEKLKIDSKDIELIKKFKHSYVFVFNEGYFTEDGDRQTSDVELSPNEFAIKRLLE